MHVASYLFLALPLFAAAESPFEQYKAQFQNFFSSFGAAKAPTAPSEEKTDSTSSAAVTEAKVSDPLPMHSLTLENWNETLYTPVVPGATKPEEWWVLISGRNKTCFGRCQNVEIAFNESAISFATVPNAPHLGYLNCDDQPVLCSAWSADTGSIWVFQVLPPPAPVNIYRKRLNLTSTTTQTLLDLHAQGNMDSFNAYEGKWFHPYNGILARNGFSLPFGYFLMYFSMIPSWAMMIAVSFVSRTFMNRRMNKMNGRPRTGAPGDAGVAAPRAQEGH